MEPFDSSHPDPFGQASAAAGQQAAQFAAVGAMFLQVLASAKTRRAVKAADTVTREEAQLSAARAQWAPAWKVDAGLHDVARAWGAAAPWEHADPGAAAALDAAETRLRELHPYAMTHYDALRAEGQSRTEAMMEAAPDFALHPSPRPAPEDANQGRYLPAGTASPGPEVVLSAEDAAAARRLLLIVSRLNDDALADGLGPVDPDVAGMILRQVSNAPDALIGAVVDGLRDGTMSAPSPVATPAASPARRTVTAAGPASLDWPGTAQQGLAAAASRSAGGSAARRPGPQARPPRLSP